MEDDDADFRFFLFAKACWSSGDIAGGGEEEPFLRDGVLLDDEEGKADILVCTCGEHM